MKTTHSCKTCGESFEDHKRQRSYCSTPCYHKARIGKYYPVRPLAERTFVCRGCGISFEGNEGDARRRKYCSTACSYAHRVADKHHNWKGGRSLIGQGYVMLRVNGRSRAEHRVIAEKALGRRMKPNEHVHHINGVKTDNDPRNLLICTDTYHRQLERRMATAFQSQFPVYTLGV